jgi:hypothetical protein
VARRHFKDGAHRFLRCAAHKLEEGLRVRLIRSLPARSVEIREIQTHRVSECYVGFLTCDAVNHAADVRIAVPVDAAILTATDQIFFSSQDSAVDDAYDARSRRQLDLGGERVVLLNKVHRAVDRRDVPLVSRIVTAVGKEEILRLDVGANKLLIKRQRQSR